MLRRSASLIIIAISITSLLFSCKPVQTVSYAKEYFDSAKVVIPDSQIPIPTIKPYDLINVDFYGKSPEVVAMLNSFSTAEVASSVTMKDVTTPSPSAGTPKSTYLVSPEGFIELPLLGKTKVSGLTLAQLKATLTDKVSKILAEPTVLVRFATFKVTILGEVKARGVFQSPNEKMTILEAMGLCGDLTMYAVKEKVKVIRDDNGQRTIGNIDLTSKDMFTSEYFYLKPNDVIYVPANGKEELREKTSTTLPYFTAGVSLAALLLTIITLSKQ